MKSLMVSSPLDSKIYLTTVPHLVWSSYLHSPPIEYSLDINQAELVHYLNVYPQTIELSRNRPFIVEFENILIPTLHTRNYSKSMQCLPFIRDILSHKNCRAIIGPSNKAMTWALRHCQDILPKYHVLPPSIQVQSKYIGLRHFALPSISSPLKLLSIGNKFWGKGMHIVLDSFNICREHLGKSVELVLVCDDIPFDVVRIPPGCSVITNSVLNEKTKASLYADSDLFVFPCLHDSMGVFLECASYGLPMLTTRIYDKDEFIYEGINGYLFDPCIELYGEGFCTKYYSWDEYVDLIIQLYKSGMFKELAGKIARKILHLGENPCFRSTLSANSLYVNQLKFNIHNRNRSLIKIYGQSLLKTVG